MLSAVNFNHLAPEQSLFARIDARIKIIFTAAAIVLVSLSGAPGVPVCIFLLVMAAMASIKAGIKVVIFRLSAALFSCFVILIIKVFVYHDSMASALLIISKVISASSALLFLSLTTTVDKLLGACRWFKVPAIWIEVCLIAYRYIFVLLDDALTIIDSQKVRMGYIHLSSALRSIGVLAGALIIRAYDQSVAVYEAMLLRGYK